MFRLLIATLLLVLMSSIAAADVVLLRNGARTEGTIVEQGDNHVTIRTANGVVQYPMHMVKSITRVHRDTGHVDRDVEPMGVHVPQSTSKIEQSAATRVAHVPVQGPAQPADSEIPQTDGESAPAAGAEYPWPISESAVRLCFTVLEPATVAGVNNREQIGERLAGFGDSMARALFVILNGDFAAFAGSVDAKQMASYHQLAAHPEIRNLINEALLSRLNESGIRGLEELAGESTDRGLKCQYLELMARSGSALAPGHVMKGLISLTDEQSVSDEQAGRIGRIAADLFGDNPAIFDWMKKNREDVPTDTLRVIASGLSSVENRSCWRELEAWSGKARDLDQLIVLRFADMASVRRFWMGDAGLELLDQSLESHDARLRFAAITVLGRLDEVDRIAAISLRLVDSDPKVREVAGEVLGDLVERDLNFTPESWKFFVGGQQDWLSSAYPALKNDLMSHDADTALAALGELHAHRMVRESFRDDLASLLGHPDPKVRVEACRTAISLGYPDVMGWMVVALGDESSEVVDAAWAGLQKITGEDRPRNPAAWMDLLH